jgi:hypothetical protein
VNEVKHGEDRGGGRMGGWSADRSKPEDEACECGGGGGGGGIVDRAGAGEKGMRREKGDDAGRGGRESGCAWR